MPEPAILQSPGGSEYEATLRKVRDGLSKEPSYSSEPSNMTLFQHAERRAKRNELLQWLQLVGILIAVGGLFLAIGRRDQTLSDLKDIVTKLLESDLRTREQLSSMRADIDNIKTRINR